MKFVKQKAEILERSESKINNIANIARICYKSENKADDESNKRLIENLIKNKHFAMLEHEDYIFDVSYVFQEQFQKRISIIESYFGVKLFLLITQNTISGNIRAWRNFYKYCFLIPAELKYIGEDLDPFPIPIVFKDNIFFNDVFENQNVSLIKSDKPYYYMQDVPELSLIEKTDLSEKMDILAHYRISAKIICDRGISHELVRHRNFSFAQESTRYCVAGDTKIYFKNHNQKFTISELYNKIQNSGNGSWKRLNVKQYNENTGELQYAHIKNVFKNGEKQCLKIKTKLGYELTCTLDHKILNKNGYKMAKDYKLNDLIYVNGTECLYRNYDWLYNQYITLNKTYTQIAKEFGFNESTIKKWGQLHKLPKKPKSYFNVGRIPWNKGIKCEKQVEALKKYHHCGRRKDKILKEDTKRYQKHNTGKCEICGRVEELNVHHIDENRENNFPNNLITLCTSCHQRVHSKNLQVAFEDKIVSIEDAGVCEVYDIEMHSDFHNYIANGVVVHNCNYNKKGIEFIDYSECNNLNNPMLNLLTSMNNEATTDMYNGIINNGYEPQLARSVLPHNLKTEIVITGNIREWLHFFNLRLFERTGKAHPFIKELAKQLFDDFEEKTPISRNLICSWSKELWETENE